MTSALAAALRELDRSREKLEQELSQNPDFAALTRLDKAVSHPTPETERRRRALLERLSRLPLFHAWQGIAAAQAHVQSGKIVLAQEQAARDAARHAGPAAAMLEPGALPFEPTHERPLVPVPVMPTFSSPPGPPQRLTAIRGIDAALASKLDSMGIRRYEQIAAWRSDDVQAIGAALKLGREISRRNWIEQAALLAARSAGPAASNSAPATSPQPAGSKPPVASPPSPPVQPAAHVVDTAATKPAIPIAIIDIVSTAARAAKAGGAALARGREGDTRLPRVDVQPPAALPMATLPATLPAPDRLTLIAGLDAALASQLAAAGIDRFKTIAAWRAADVRAAAVLLGVPTLQIQRQGWIEQAALLASGRMTHYATRVDRGELAALRPAPPPAPLPSAVVLPVAPPPSRMLDPAAAAAAAALLVPAGPERAYLERPHLERQRPERSLSRMLKAEEVAAQPTAHNDEATVAIIRAPVPLAVARTDAFAPQPAIAPMLEPNAIGAEHAAARAPVVRPPDARSPELDDLAPLSTAATGEEAVVEIIRRDDPLVSAGRGAAGQAAMNRVKFAKTPARPLQPEDAPQPVWIAERPGDAGGVMRRFLRALKGES